MRTTFIYLFLFILAIPWYWSEDESRLLFGMPIWVSVSILVSLIISIFTAYLYLSQTWPGEKNNE